MNLAELAAAFGLVFVGELPDKTMFASLALASRGRPWAVWAGASAAFAVHVVIAVAVGGVLEALVPHRLLQVVVAVGFLAGAAWAWRSRGAGDEELDAVPVMPSAWRVAFASASVIFVAEWGDLTQVLIVQLAAHYDPLSVGVGSFAALVVVAGLAAVAGSRLMRRFSVRTLRTAMAVVLLALGVYTAVAAALG